ncbi:hypothetical protein RIR_jg6894.t1 [Rhizophagus irregularis DAOM 181602=DAOM 197198]|nr:hypothetical protein RIR_jg6894.t1 [Rhizophagus irregularis DAOM 181602=DAOM 197198]
MIKALEPGYDPPSRRVLNGTLLEAELSRINARVNNELEKESNFTIALDDALLHVLDNHEREISNEAVKAILKKRGIFNKRYKEFDEDIYLLGFFLHPKYQGHGMRDNQFERLRNS